MADVVAKFSLNNRNINARFDLDEGNTVDAIFKIDAAGTTWGSIDGDIANQTDLYNILNTKANQSELDSLSETVSNNYTALESEINGLSTVVDNNYSETVERFENDELAVSNLTNTVSSNYTELNNKVLSNTTRISSISDTINSFGDIVTYNASDFATSAQGALANTALQPGDNISELNNNVGYITSASLPTLEDLTTQVQLDAINSGATTSKINQIASNTQAISTETANRQNADNNLQSQIDAITASSDVTDIVGNYAQLQAYDTSTLAPNSIIKVLQDEHQNNETTYYRWVITGGVGAWVLIGEEGPYYTKSEADGRFVPQTRTINGKDLSNNISLDASDVGALPSSTVIPTVNNGTLDIQVNGTSVGTFTANQSGNTTANIVVPDSATWGNITGDIADQTDLQDALDDKQDVLTAGTDLEIIKGGDVVDLPEGYTQVEHIALSGTYFDTGIYGDQDTKITTRFYTDSFTTMNIYGVNHNKNTQSLTAYIAASATSQGNWRFGSRTNAFSVSRNVWHEAVQDKNGVLLDDVLYPYSTVADFTTVYTLGFGNAKTATGEWGTAFNGLISKYIIEKGEDIVANYIPCKNLNGIYGFYDLVSETFKTPIGGSFQGSDEVVAGTVINFTNETGYITGIDSTDVTTALGYTPVNASSLATVATSGDYDDLINKPTIPTVGDGTITITQGGVTKGTFTTNQSGNSTIALDAGGGGGSYSAGTGIDITNDTISIDTSVVAQLSDIPTNYVTTDTAQNITGTKTFIGQKKIAFKQSGTSDKLGFTLYNNSGTEKGYLEYNPSNNIDGVPLMTLGNYATASGGLTHVGFRKYSSISGASGAYNLLTPLISDAKTPFSLTTTYTNFYLPLGFTDGTTTVKTAKSGMVDLSSIIPTATSDLTNDSGFITSIPTATSGTLGIVQPDNTTITIDSNGVISSNGASRNVGEVITSTLPLTDAGLHLLDGTLLQYGIYQEFIDYIADLYAENPTANYFTDETTWQASVTQYGSCGKFVYTAPLHLYAWKFNNSIIYTQINENTGKISENILYNADGTTYEDGYNETYTDFGGISIKKDNIITIGWVNPNSTKPTTRVKTIIYQRSAEDDVDIVESVRLPKISDILQSTTDINALGDLVEAGLPNITGNTEREMKSSSTNVPTNRAAFLYLDASKSNPIYGNSNTVQPQTIKAFVYIVVANSTKTSIQVDIDEIATDLNGKADVSLSNVNSTGSSTGAGWAMPSDTYIDLTLGASGSTYTAPANGWFVLKKIAGTVNTYAFFTNQTNGMTTGNVYTIDWQTAYLYMPVKKGDIIKITYTITGNTDRFRFIYAVGSESEAN